MDHRPHGLCWRLPPRWAVVSQDRGVRGRRWLERSSVPCLVRVLRRLRCVSRGHDGARRLGSRRHRRRSGEHAHRRRSADRGPPRRKGARFCLVRGAAGSHAGCRGRFRTRTRRAPAVAGKGPLAARAERGRARAAADEHPSPGPGDSGSVGAADGARGSSVGGLVRSPLRRLPLPAGDHCVAAARGRGGGWNGVPDLHHHRRRSPRRVSCPSPGRPTSRW